MRIEDAQKVLEILASLDVKDVKIVCSFSEKVTDALRKEYLVVPEISVWGEGLSVIAKFPNPN